VADLPHERSLVARLQKKPFALVGISADTDRSSYKSMCEQNGVTWPSFIDADPAVKSPARAAFAMAPGPIFTTWHVQKLPTIYVLDAKGVIRFQDVRGPKLDKAVDELVAEAEAPPK
jgi:peroxiredoxin